MDNFDGFNLNNFSFLSGGIYNSCYLHICDIQPRITRCCLIFSKLRDCYTIEVRGESGLMINLKVHKFQSFFTNIVQKEKQMTVIEGVR